ncbi:MAG: FG-GAP repeat protein [Pseudomonadales bacterium]
MTVLYGRGSLQQPGGCNHQRLAVKSQFGAALALGDVDGDSTPDILVGTESNG